MPTRRIQVEVHIRPTRRSRFWQAVLFPTLRCLICLRAPARWVARAAEIIGTEWMMGFQLRIGRRPWKWMRRPKLYGTYAFSYGA